MFQRMTCFAALAAGLFALASSSTVAQPDKKPSAADLAKAKKAIQEVQDFIGLWNLEGTQKDGARTIAWKEQVRWSWKFKDGDSWMTVNFDDGKGKYFLNGELRYDVAKKKYLLTLNPAQKGAAKQVFEGEYTRGALRMTSKDAKTGDVSRITMNTAAEGVRFILKYEKQEGGKGLFSDVYAMNGSKDGESFAAGGKKQECIVSGGSASMAVSYNGKTYYVCCSGCRDEFNANPKKYAK